MRTGRRSSCASYALRNDGNAPLCAYSKVKSADEGVTVECFPGRLTAPPGQSAAFVARATAKRWIFVGAPVDHGFEIEVDLGAEAPLQTVGTFRQAPIVPRAAVRLAVVLIVIASVVAVLALRHAATNRPQAIPSVLGLSVREAEGAARSAGFLPVVRTVVDDDHPEGAVGAQDPSPGAHRRANSRVVVIASSGPSRIEIPDLRRSSELDARLTLDNLGLHVAAAGQAADSLPAGAVVSQDPPAGAAVAKGSAVKITLSTGPAADRPVRSLS